jgi:REP element-mobilizing transposase RayT
MPRARFLAPWKNSPTKPALYHCISRVVDRRFVLNENEREHFRKFMRMQENFSGCRILSYCLMSNHFHLLLEVPPFPANGLTDQELLHRLRATYTEPIVANVAKELAEARKQNRETWAAEIHARFTYRMHDLSEFMKTLLQRFTRWFNRTHDRTGTLWEERYKSVIVEDGTAARTIAAYIDLNPVRAGIVTDPAKYRWSSYGEAIGGGTKGNGKKSREGLVRAFLGHQGVGLDSAKWPETSRQYRRLMAFALERKNGHTNLTKSQKQKHKTPKPQLNTTEMLESGENDTLLPDHTLATILLHRIRYFTDGAVIGSKAFVNDTFEAARDRFTPTRKTGARRLKGPAKQANNLLFSLRDLRVRL